MNDAMLFASPPRVPHPLAALGALRADSHLPALAAGPVLTLPPLLAAVLDEVDVPMVLVDARGALIHANRVARRELQAGQHPLELAEGRIRVRAGAGTAKLGRDLAASLGSSFRRVIRSDESEDAPAISVIPIVLADLAETHATLLVLGRRRLCPSLTVDWFARTHALTSTEARVLALLCTGMRPSEVAERQGVAISTVRTHVMSIRTKTLASSIQDLVAQVARLPPMIGLYEPAC